MDWGGHYRQVLLYLHSDRTMCIKLKIELQTGSKKHITGHVKYLECSMCERREGGGVVHHTSQSGEHITFQLSSL